MKELVIVSAGGLGREAYWLAHEPKDAFPITIKGFLDDRSIDLAALGIPHPILSSPSAYEPQANDVFLVAIADPLQKAKYITLLKKKNVQLYTLVHRTAMLSSRTLNEGMILDANCVISCNIRFGISVTVGSFSHIGHDTSIGDYTHIGSLSFIGGNAQIGHSCIIHPHATILAGVKIGNRCVVGAGAVVLKDVPDDQTVFGNPALPVKWQKTAT